MRSFPDVPVRLAKIIDIQSRRVIRESRETSWGEVKRLYLERQETQPPSELVDRIRGMFHQAVTEGRVEVPQGIADAAMEYEKMARAASR